MFEQLSPMKTLDKLSTPEYWNETYKTRGLAQNTFENSDWRNYVAIQLAKLIESLGLDGISVCELGGGDAELLCYLAKRHPTSKFAVFDYSPVGCEMARARSTQEKVEIAIHLEDIFSPPRSLIGAFDLVISQGVVEHFSDLARILCAKKQLIKTEGKMFALIPNFSSPIYRALCRYWSKTVYETHNPHDLKSFVQGHKDAGLIVESSGYVGSVEFGVISAAMYGPEPKSKVDKEAYLFLTRVSKIAHYIEHKTFDFPTSKLLSPLIYVISRKG